MMRMILLILLLLLSGCSSDYEGVVMEKFADSFILGIPVDDPEAESPAYEVTITDSTVFSGSVDSFEELEEESRVTVLPEANDELLSEGQLIAEEVIVH
ncbi:hypothetical protein [Indiicoccus explosivorum]|uniref:hypothetical protein n=1 Tax=Indiicoccus explosivorum TaxID=1917864 RepID=UPI000B43C7A9|nr:hypothetical protein [Indiicoccus explosivorum]